MTIRYTHTDLVLATAYFPILVEYTEKYRAASSSERAQWLVTYGDLVAQAKTRHPDVPEIQNATNINAGRRLGVIRQIANGDCPDMSCLIVNKTIKETGEAYQGEFDSSAERSKLLSNDGDAPFDFKAFVAEFLRRVESIRASVPDTPSRKTRAASPPQRKPKVSEDHALQSVHQYYLANRTTMPASIKSMRESIVQWIMQAMPVEDAFKRAIDHLVENPPADPKQLKAVGKPK
jgi:hypothetical protein